MFGRPTEEEIANADYGAPIAQDEAEGVAVKWLGQFLDYPKEMTLWWEPVFPTWIRDPYSHGGTVHWGYRLQGLVKAKGGNSIYSTKREYYFLFYNGTLITVHGQKNVDGKLHLRKLQ